MPHVTWPRTFTLAAAVITAVLWFGMLLVGRLVYTY